MSALRRAGRLGILGLALGAGHASAGEAAPRFELPVDCPMGELCFIQNYVDHDPGPEARDYACGVLTYDGHTGTDIRLPNLVAMQEGVAVLAAASGVVRATRNGMADVSTRETGREAVRSREAGNGVVIDHGGGWATQYSHLRRGSVAVRRGQRVQTGEALGLIGLSGDTEFPHLEFTVRYLGEPVDPFVGLVEETGCGVDARPLWSPTALEALAYIPTGLLSAGFAAEAPDPEAARKGAYLAPMLPENAPALVFWVDVFGVLAGDEERARVIAPDGAVLVENIRRLEKHKAQWFSFIGKRLKAAAWPAGRYLGEYLLLRETNGGWQVIVSTTREVELR